MGLRWHKRSTCTTPRQQIEEGFTPAELQQVLSLRKAGKAAGPDGIAPDFLRHLSSKGSSVLLNIFNSSWLSSWCPRPWRSAYVVPFLKKGKDPAEVASYRLISLTSTIGKVLERLIANGQSWGLEEHSALSPRLAGLRKERCTTDQCLRLSEFISDGFQSTQRRRIIVTFFDFSLAYDRVWRTGLLIKMSKMGVPRRSTEWLSFIS